MVLDHLDNAGTWSGLNRRIALALDFLRRPATRGLEPSQPGPENSLRVAIGGDDVFALIQRYRTKSPGEAFWEAHRQYIDVQCVIEGAERMGCVPLAMCRVVMPYDTERDFAKLEPTRADAVNFFAVRTGSFAIFHPHDVHMPGLIADDQPMEVKKVVVKVRC